MKRIAETLAVVLLASIGIARADENAAGKWKGQFDSQIGLQKYTYDFKVDGDKLTGKAFGVMEMGTNEVQIADGKIVKDEISFVEPMKFEENEIRIEYKGKVSGDEIKFTRKVGDFATEEFVAKRVKEGEAKPGTTAEAKPEAKPDTKATAQTKTNSPPAKP